jgi:heme oxygenase (biliverdin-IX-beta and delta-forming)
VILEQLKSETAAAHASIEQRLRIARSRPSVSDYRNYLAAMYGFTAPIEQRLRSLADGLGSELELERRCKSQLLARDLAVLDARLDSSNQPAELCRALPENRDLTQALGTLYVLEGSTLGARWLLRHLQPLGVEDCCSYLRSYGDALGDMWEKMRRALVLHAERHPGRIPELIAAASDTFHKLDDWCVHCQAAEAGPDA